LRSAIWSARRARVTVVALPSGGGVAVAQGLTCLLHLLE
jgi:hypothetical protein